MVKLQSISASSRWLQCTKSLEYNKDFKSNVFTLKGNLIHEVSALRLREIFFKENHQEAIERLKTSIYVDEKDSNLKTEWTNECEKTSDGYINYALRLYQQFNPHTIEIEKKINVRWYGYEKFGYIDLLMISNDYTIIVDLKTGRGEVETQENSQMLIYTLGQIQETNNKKEMFLGNYITAICQPLINNIKAVEYSKKHIVFFYRSFANKMEEIISGNLQYSPSPVACKYCDYRNKCAERMRQGIL